jgi:hypothetical protein
MSNSVKLPTVLNVKLTVAQIAKNSPTPMEPEGSLPCSQEPTLIMLKDIPMNEYPRQRGNKQGKKQRKDGYKRNSEYIYIYIYIAGDDSYSYVHTLCTTPPSLTTRQPFAQCVNFSHSLLTKNGPGVTFILYSMSQKSSTKEKCKKEDVAVNPVFPISSI